MPNNGSAESRSPRGSCFSAYLMRAAVNILHQEAKRRERKHDYSNDGFAPIIAIQPTIEAIPNRTFGLHSGSTAVGEIADIAHLISARRSSLRLKPDPSRTYDRGGVLCSLEYIASGHHTRYVLRILGSEIRRGCQCLRHSRCVRPTNASRWPGERRRKAQPAGVMAR
jgi:hypothetical protein